MKWFTPHANSIVDTAAKRWLIVILISAVSLRLLVVFILFGDYFPTEDAADWHLAAQNLLAGHGLIYTKGFRAYRTPVPAVYFAAIYSVFGVSVRAVQIANVFLGVLTVWLIYDLVRRSFGIVPARWAAVLVSCQPALLLYTGQLLSETLVIMLLALALWLVWGLRNRPTYWVATVGIVLGVAVLTRESMLPIAVLIALWTFVDRQGKGWLQTIAPASLILVFLALTLTPWMIRNYLIFDRFVPLTTKGGLSLWTANNPLADGTGREQEALEIQGLKILRFNALPEAERGFVAQKMAIQFITENPLKFFQLSLQRLSYFWHIRYRGEGLAEITFLAIYLSMLALDVVGAWLGWRSNRDATLLFLILPVSLTLVHMVFLPVGRYRLPADLILCVFAGYGMHWIFSRAFGKLIFPPIVAQNSLLPSRKCPD